MENVLYITEEKEKWIRKCPKCNNNVYHKTKQSCYRSNKEKRNCKTCYHIERIPKNLKSKYEFIKDAIKIHGRKYDYSKVIYNNSHTNIIILCSIHGEFKQMPYSHLNGRGCKLCYHDSQKNSLESFIKKSQNIHGNRYDYSLSKYNGCLKKIKIICKKCKNIFYQLPWNHSVGNGCPKCSKNISKPEINFLDYLNIPNTLKNRQVRIKNKRVDGYDPKTNTIYEFLGDYWHGNLKKYNKNDTNEFTGKSFKLLNKELMKKFKIFKTLGYNVKYIWESDWKKFIDGINSQPKILNA